MADTIPTRKFLVDGLHESLARLEKALVRDGDSGHPYLVLQRLVVRCADEETLERLLTEIKREIERLEGTMTETGLLTETRERNRG